MPRRISRHLYDFYCLLRSDIKDKALAEENLLERVAIHKSIYFASGWASYGTARRGTLKLSPQGRSSECTGGGFSIDEGNVFGRDSRLGFDLEDHWGV
jgi:hypothetical protein